jgi:tetratricopeptide (TPR) repeat protein
MNLRLVALASFIALITYSIWAQLPSPQKLSMADNRDFNKELERLRSLLSTANDKAVIQLQIANTYAAGGQYEEAIQCLREVVDADLGFDPSRDPDFSACAIRLSFSQSWKKLVAKRRQF